MKLSWNFKVAIFSICIVVFILLGILLYTNQLISENNIKNEFSILEKDIQARFKALQDKLAQPEITAVPNATESEQTTGWSGYTFNIENDWSKDVTLAITDPAGHSRKVFLREKYPNLDWSGYGVQVSDRYNDVLLLFMHIEADCPRMGSLARYNLADDTLNIVEVSIGGVKSADNHYYAFAEYGPQMDERANLVPMYESNVLKVLDVATGEVKRVARLTAGQSFIGAVQCDFCPANKASISWKDNKTINYSVFSSSQTWKCADDESKDYQRTVVAQGQVNL